MAASRSIPSSTPPKERDGAAADWHGAAAGEARARARTAIIEAAVFMVGTPYLYRLGEGVYKDSMPDPFDGPGEPGIVYEGPGLAAVYKPPRMHSAPGAGSGDLC